MSKSSIMFVLVIILLLSVSANGMDYVTYDLSTQKGTDGISIIHHVSVSGNYMRYDDDKYIYPKNQSSLLFIGKIASEEENTLFEIVIPFDTRNLPKNVKIIAATLYVTFKWHFATENHLWFSIVQGDDRQENINPIEGSYKIVKELNPDEIQIAIPLNEIGITWIKPGEITNLGIYPGMEYGGIQKKLTNILSIYSSANKNPEFRPFLRVVCEKDQK